MNTEDRYPVADWHKLPPAVRLWPATSIMAKWNGEYRPPLKGEWYLSGALITAYCAVANLTSNFHIARLVRVIAVTTYKEEPIPGRISIPDAEHIQGGTLQVDL